MGFLNFNYGLMDNEDQASSPQIRNIDISQSFQGLTSTNENMAKVTLGPGERQTIAATLRALGLDGTSQLSLSRPIAQDGTMRLSWAGTGSAPSFRAARALGLTPSTSVSIVRAGPNTARLTATGASFAAVQVGDILLFQRNTDSFTSPFSSPNVGNTFTVQAVGTNSVDFIDNGAAGLDTVTGADQAFLVMSAGPVKAGDTVYLQGAWNGSNVGEFTLTNVTPTYVEFANPYGVPEAVTLSTTSVARVYNHLMTFLHVAATGPVQLAFDGGTPMRVGPLGTGGQIVFMGAVYTYQVDAVNTGTTPITVTIRHMSVS